MRKDCNGVAQMKTETKRLEAIEKTIAALRFKTLPIGLFVDWYLVEVLKK